MSGWVLVPAGPFAMGRDAADAYPPDEDERPRRLVSHATFLAPSARPSRELHIYRTSNSRKDSTE